MRTSVVLLALLALISSFAFAAESSAQRVVNGRAVIGRAPTRQAVRDLPQRQRQAYRPQRTRGAATACDFIGQLDDDTLSQPNARAAVGPNHLVSVSDLEYRVQMRDGTEVSTIAPNDFWTTQNMPAAFKSSVLYDADADRWIVIAACDAQMATAGVLIAVSDTADPTGNWTMNRINVMDDSADAFWVDWPRLGMTADLITISCRLFDDPAGAFQRNNFYAIDKAGLYNADPIAYTILEDATDQVVVPAVTNDSMESTQYLLSVSDASSGEVTIWTITGTIGNEVLTEGGAIGLSAPWGSSAPMGADLAPQMDAPELIHAGDDRLQNVLYANGNLWSCHTVYLPDAMMPDRTAVQWFELMPDTSGMTPDGMIVQEGRIDDAMAMVHRAYPSIAVNEDGDALIGYSRFAGDSCASAAYSFRWSNDALGTTQAEVIYKAGEASYVDQDINMRNRFGTSSSTLMDPANPTDFFTFQNYASMPDMMGDRWGLWWANVTVTNEVPSIDSMPTLMVQRGANYSYAITAMDADHAGDQLSFTAPTLPMWLTLTDNGDGTATLSGTPAVGDNGMHDVVLEVSDGKDSAQQMFTIEVIGAPSLRVESPAGIPRVSGGTLELDGVVESGSATGISFTLLNNGDEPLLLTGSPNPVTIDNSENCVAVVSNQPGASVQPAGSDSVGFSITPTAGGDFSFSFSIPNNDAVQGNFSYSVTGRAGTRARMRVTYLGGGSLQSGAANPNPAPSIYPGSAVAMNLRIWNSGNGLLQLNGPTPVGLDFSYNANVSLVQPDAFVPAGSWRDVRLSVSARNAGEYGFSLRIWSNDPDQQNVLYRFTGNADTSATAQLVVERLPGVALATDASVELGEVRTNQTREVNYWLRNTGAATLTLSGPPSVTAQTNVAVSWEALDSLTLLAGQSKRLTLELDAEAMGALSFTLNITADGEGNAYALMVSGTAVNSGAASLAVWGPDDTELATGSSITVAGAEVGVTRLIRFVVENRGGAELALNLPVEVINPANANVSIHSNPSATLAAWGGWSEFVVAVTPVSSGAASFSLRLTSDDAVTPAWNADVMLDAVSPRLAVWNAARSFIAEGSTWNVAVAAENEDPQEISGYLANLGNGTLTLVGTPAVENAVGCDVSLLQAPLLSIAPATWTGWSLSVTPDTTDDSPNWAFDLVITSDDPDTPTYRVTFTRVDPPVISTSGGGNDDDSSCSLQGGSRQSTALWLLLIALGVFGVARVRREA